MLASPLTKGMRSSEMKSVHLSPEATPLRALPPMPALLAFARAGAQLSFRRAARDLALSPSAVSHQIRGLEERFGVRLFARGVRSVRLTAEGAQYLRAVTAALATLDEASRTLLRRKQGRQHELRVSSLPLFTSAVLLPALAAFERRNPGFTLRIDATPSYADFDDPSVDVAIRYGRERAEGLRHHVRLAGNDEGELAVARAGGVEHLPDGLFADRLRKR